jgi:hypothetical protein
MKRWLAMGALGLTLAGCATGMPGSSTRAFYNLCVVEGREPEYCEAWASAEAHKMAAGGISGVVVVPLGQGR